MTNQELESLIKLVEEANFYELEMWLPDIEEALKQLLRMRTL